jgi:hypothetical protein
MRRKQKRGLIQLLKVNHEIVPSKLDKILGPIIGFLFALPLPS